MKKSGVLALALLCVVLVSSALAVSGGFPAGQYSTSPDAFDFDAYDAPIPMLPYIHVTSLNENWYWDVESECYRQPSPGTRTFLPGSGEYPTTGTLSNPTVNLSVLHM